MKKLCNFILIIVLLVAVVYGYNFVTGKTIDLRLENLTKKEISTTQLRTSKKQDSRNAETFEKQLYNALTDDEKKAYDTIYSAISSYEPSVFVYENIEADRLFELVRLVISVHPEIFWSRGDCTFTSAGKLIFDYPYTRQEAEEKNALIEKRAKEIIEEISPSDDEYESSLAIFDYIVKSTSYDYNAAENLSENFKASTIEGVFLEGTAVCSGYSRAYQYLLSLAGIDAITVTGDAQTPTGNGPHAWVAQRVNGEIYFTDTTWGDSYEKSANKDFASHVYFLTTSAELEKTHKCDEIFADIKGTSDNDNYFIKQSVYFEKYSLAEIRDRIKNSIDNAEPGIELKFADAEQYKTAQQDLFDGQNIYYILKTIDPFSRKIDTDNISYGVDDTHNVITIFYCFNI